MYDRLGHLGLPIINLDQYGFSNSFAGRAFVQYHGSITTTSAGQEISARLSEDTRVGDLSGKLIPCGLNNSASFDKDILAAWWIMRANEAGLTQADTELETYLSSDVVDVIVSHWIVGLNPSKSMALGDGYDLFLLEDMPDSDSKERYLQAINKWNRLDGSIPRAAICKIVSIPKIKIEYGGKLVYNNIYIFEEMLQFIRLFNCLPGAICLPWIQTSHLPVSVPTGLLGTSDLRWPYSDFSFQKVVDIPNLDSSMMQKLITGFRALDEKWYKRVSMALDRFALAKATKNIQSSALDLGISLEMILLAGEGEKSQIRQKFSLRGSWLIGNDGVERLHLFKSFQRIYDDRSSVAHDGFSDSLQKKISAGDKAYLEENFTLAERVFCKIIVDGPPLSWDALVLDA